MTEEEARELVKEDGKTTTLDRSYRIAQAVGYIEAIEKAKGLEQFAKVFISDKWAHNDKTDQETCVVCEAEKILAQWGKEK